MHAPSLVVIILTYARAKQRATHRRTCLVQCVCLEKNKFALHGTFPNNIKSVQCMVAAGGAAAAAPTQYEQ